jgi:anti-sigma factor RsiW
MSKDLKNIQEIDEYISGELDQEHRNEFEKKILADKNIQDDLNITKQVIEGIQGYAFKKMLSDIHARLYGKSTEENEQ